MIFLGIDAGGTKSILSLCDETGQVLSALRRPPISFLALGKEGLREALEKDTRDVLREAKLLSDKPLCQQLSAFCYGAPGHGESTAGDAAVAQAVKDIFGDIPTLICNDAQVAWAGSCALRPGINILAGTGAMAFGMDAHGNTARCGGWGHFFADEGSGYWLGMRMLSLFCKEADGRLPRGALYTLIREKFKLNNDFEIVDVMREEYLPHRSQVASLQLLLLEAARAGDENAILAYREAGEEIAQNVRGILSRLDFPPGTDVAYSGGIFKTGELVMQSFRQSLETLHCKVVHPLAPPWTGALMLALDCAGRATPQALNRLIEAGKEE